MNYSNSTFNADMFRSYFAIIIITDTTDWFLIQPVKFIIIITDTTDWFLIHQVKFIIIEQRSHTFNPDINHL